MSKSEQGPPGSFSPPQYQPQPEYQPQPQHQQYPPMQGQQYPPQQPMMQPMQPGFAPATHTTVIVQGTAGDNGQARPQNVRDFSSGICDCFSDCGSCVLGYFCLPCLACKTAGRIGEDCCCTGFCLAPTTWVAMRTKLRVMYGINGSIASDCCCIYFCNGLAICQMSRELDRVGL